jgi:hypothetical protein
MQSTDSELDFNSELPLPQDSAESPYSYDYNDIPEDSFSDEDLEDEELLAELEGQEDFSGGTITAPIFTPVAVVLDLDDLLAESMNLKRESGKGKSLRDELRKAQNEADRKAIEQKIRAWEDAYEWDNKAHCVFFERVQCSCGSLNSVFAGYFYHQTHKHQSGTQRWVKTEDTGKRQVDPSVRDSLPKQVLYKTAQIPTCEFCAHLQGFDPLKGTDLWQI